ncbi:hypothetical protein B0H13DRAFT_1897876 [Mycena leptocephala]|nr:hypothetical protein B0H13DRAFT_1897876 [Mycena leptocephala]
MIPMGDIDLLEEIRLNNETGVVGRHHPERTRVWRMYSAKIDGRKSGVTVAMYQGDGAEEEWWQDIASYMTLRIWAELGNCADKGVDMDIWVEVQMQSEDMQTLSRRCETLKGGDCTALTLMGPKGEYGAPRVTTRGIRVMVCVETGGSVAFANKLRWILDELPSAIKQTSARKCPIEVQWRRIRFQMCPAAMFAP